MVAMAPRSQGDSEKTYEGNFTLRRGRDIGDLIGMRRLSPVVVVAWSRAVSEILSYTEQSGSAMIRALVMLMVPDRGYHLPPTTYHLPPTT